MTKVHIALGSRSDLKTLAASKMLPVLDAVGIDYAVHVCSAHRNSDALADFVHSVCADGNEEVLFIAIAGMAAALPGALAGLSGMRFPVLAVPLDEHGIDPCLYMPPGVPVATMGVGSAGLHNAAIFACQVLASGSNSIWEAFWRYLDSSAKPAEFNLDPAEFHPGPTT